MSASRRRALRLAAVLFAALVCALVLAPAPAALAVGPPVLSNPSPAPGIPGLPNTWVSVGVSATGSSPLTGACTLRVDNSVVSAAHWSYAEAGGHWEWDDWYEEDVWVPDYDTTAGWFGYTMRFSNGSHAATVTVTDSAGRTSSYAWTFTVGGPPAVQALSPSDGAVATSPVVPLSAYVVDNYGVLSSVTMWLDGAVVPATYVNKWLRYTPPPLAEGSTHTVTVVAVDSTGPSTTCTWSFLVHAGPPTFAGDAPGPTPPATTWDPTIAVTASDLATLSPPTSYRIDGSPVAGSFAFAPDHHSGTASIPATMLADGPHTASVTIANVAGTSATHSWGFTVAAPPVAGSQSPAPGSTVSTATPAVSALVTENSPGTITASATVDGIHATSTYDPATKKANVTPLVALSDDATHTVTLALTDAAGNSSTSVWSFFVQTSPGMPVAGECTASGCHTGYPSGHPVGSCDACHEPGGPLAGCTTCHSSGAHTDSVLSSYDCSYCHGANPTVPTHPADLDAAHATTQDMASCDGTGCHASRLTVEHEARGMTCAGCHDSTDPAVASAISSGTTRCGACHTDLSGSGHEALHTVDPTTCTGCHGGTSLSTIHATCDTCHTSTDPDVVAAISGHDKSCDACHDAEGVDYHLHAAAKHVLPTTPTCVGSGCHDAAATTVFEGRTVAQIHSDATTTTGGVTRSGCGICHVGGGVTPTTDCGSAGCHPDRLIAHGYDPAKHAASGSCVLTCHTPLQGLTELKTVHDAVQNPVTCSGCHASKVAEIAPWDKTCTACHPIASLHPTAAASHVGTDTAYQDASFFGGGCSPNSVHTDQSNCHDISNVAQVHSRMPGNGCQVCHGSGKTPAQECLDCHKPGYANSYTVPGTPSADILATGYPSSDDFITPGWTYTTTPAGQPRYAVVNAPYPPVDTTRYVTITSNTAGGVMFGWNGVAIPDNAVIRDVRIYAKGKAATASPARKMQGVFSIGGQQYLSSNQSANLTTVWTAGAGTGFATSSTRLDFTREPLYGEMIWRNPKTGQDWTPAELNGTDPDSSLEAFGVNLTASATANNISLSQIYLKVTYYTVGTSVTNPTVGTHTYHGDNVKYLHDPSDAPAGQRFAVSPAHGWYDALYYQDCYDFCHRGNGGAPTFSANQGSWMWYSVGGDPTDPVVATRTLALKAITLPADSPALTFDTDYQLGTGAAGYVEASTDDGGSWTPLTGTVGGTARSSLTGNSTGWVAASYDLSAYAGQSVRLRFRYVNGSSTSAGWAFDGLAITGAGGTVFSDDAETLKPDWTNTYWTRAKGAFPYQ